MLLGPYITLVLLEPYIHGLPEPIVALKSLYKTKCALLDRIVNFGTQIVKRYFDGSKLVHPVFGRHLGFQNGRHLGPIFSNISKKKDNLRAHNRQIFS